MYYISKINPEVKHIGKILCVKSNQISVKSKQYIKNVFSGKLSWKITKGYFIFYVQFYSNKLEHD